MSGRTAVQLDGCQTHAVGAARGMTALIAVAVWLVNFPGLLADGPTTKPLSNKLVRHGERALRGDDFQAPVPDEPPTEDGVPIEAYSHTGIHYEYQPRFRRRGKSYLAEPIQLHLFAVFDQQQSWNTKPDSAALLDHHQGHFDLAQITVLEIERQLKKNGMEDIVGRGSTQNEAARVLDQQIQRFLQGHLDSLDREHKYFDQATRYGTLSDVEARERARQKKLLKQYLLSEPADRP